jgi:thiol-disulfide isomerase/thioredoxin
MKIIMINKKVYLALVILITVVSCEVKDNSKAVKIELQDKLQKADSIQILTFNMLDYSENILLNESNLDLKDKPVDINLERPVFATLKVDETYHQIYLEPGFDMKINLDIQDESMSLSYSGDGSETNNYLEQSSQIITEFYRLNPTWFQSDLRFFKNKLDSIELNLKSALAKHDLDQKTLEILKTKNQITLINLKQQHRLINSDAYLVENPSDSLPKLSEDIPFDPRFLELSILDYAQVLDLYLRAEIEEPLLIGTDLEELDSLKDFFPVASNQMIKERDFPKAISEFLIAKDISYWLASEGLSDGLIIVYNEFMTAFPESDYKDQLEKKYSEWQRIGNGQSAPEITGLTLDNDTISLSDLRGKVVYIDVWATWCSPCLAEFPYYRNLFKELGGNENVEFLFLSVDNQGEKWKTFLSEKDAPKGIHIREGVGFGHPLVQESYNMWGVPRYILIDREGKIVDAKAPNPSSGKVAGLIKELID